MAKANEIGSGSGISPLGERYREDVYYYTPRPKKNGIKKLRAGEVVHGTVLKVISDKELTVRLPTGTYQAEIFGDLRSGDSLFFKVQELSPALVLKVHSVSLKNSGRELDRLELARILSIPNKGIYMQLIDEIRKYKTVIVKDDILLIIKAYLSIFGKKQKTNEIPLALKALFFMNEASVPLNKEYYDRLIPIFSDLGDFLQALNDLEVLIDKSDKSENTRLSDIFNLLGSSESAHFDLLQVFNSSESGGKSSNYNLLAELNAIIDGGDVENLSNGPIQKVIDLIKSLDLWNRYAYENNMPLLYYIPFPVRGNYQVAGLTLSGINRNDDSKKKFPGFIFPNELKKFEAEEQLSNHPMIVFDENESDPGWNKFYNGYSQYIESVFSSIGYRILSYSTGSTPDKDLFRTANPIGMPMRRFTIIV